MSPLSQFIDDLQIPGCQVHVGLHNRVISALTNETVEAILAFHDKDDIYFLGGVKMEKADRAEDDDVMMKNYFFIDFDIRSYFKKTRLEDISDEAIIEMGEYIKGCLDNHPFLKNIRYTVFSGNGIHLYYFGAPIPMQNKEWWKAGMAHIFAEAQQAVGIDVDKTCKNAGRISRLPGTFNNKNDRHVETKIIYHNPEAIFDINYIQQYGQYALSKNIATTVEAPKGKPEGVPVVVSTFEAINKLPIAPIVCELFGWAMDKGDHHFVTAGSTKRKACFIPEGENFLAHGGTDHLPPSKTGYSVFDLVKTKLNLENDGVYAWFKQRYPDIEKISKQEYVMKKENEFPFVSMPEMLRKAATDLDNVDPEKIFEYGYPPLDNHLGGIYPGELVMIGGESGTGKTTFVTSILKHNAKKHPVVFFSLEDVLTDYSYKQIWFEIGKIRRAKGMKNYPWIAFRNNLLKDDDYYLYREEAIEHLSGNRMLFYDRGHPNAPAQMNIEKLEELIQKAALKGYKLMGVDHLHFFNMRSGKENKTDKIEEVMQRIKTLCDKLGISVVLLAHYKKLGGEKPTIDAFKDSSAIPQTANVVINMWRDRSDDLGSDERETHFMLPKVRSPVGEKTIVMRFNPYTFEYELIRETAGTKQALTKEKEIALMKKPMAVQTTMDHVEEVIPEVPALTQ